MAKVKLPPLPELEPKGSIATYLSQVRQKRADEQIMNPTAEDNKPSTADDHRGKLNPHLEGESNTEPLESSVISQFKDDSIAPNDSKNIVLDLNEGSERDASQDNGLSKILDNPPSEPNRVENPADKDSTSMDAFSKESNEQHQVVTKRSRAKAEVSTKSTLAVVKLINSLPNRFSTGFFAKGESKVRLSEEMAELIQIIVDCSARVDQPKYFADNLVNHLLKEFFIKYASDIEQLSIEQQEQQLIQHRKKLTLFKRSVNP